MSNNKEKDNVIGYIVAVVFIAIIMFFAIRFYMNEQEDYNRRTLYVQNRIEELSNKVISLKNNKTLSYFDKIDEIITITNEIDILSKEAEELSKKSWLFSSSENTSKSTQKTKKYFK